MVANMTVVADYLQFLDQHVDGDNDAVIDDDDDDLENFLDEQFSGVCETLSIGEELSATNRDCVPTQPLSLTSARYRFASPQLCPLPFFYSSCRTRLLHARTPNLMFSWLC